MSTARNSCGRHAEASRASTDTSLSVKTVSCGAGVGCAYGELNFLLPTQTIEIDQVRK